MKEGRKWCGMVTAVFTALVLSGVIASRGSAITTEEELKNWPAACYRGADLEKVREWEKTWAGKRINKDNIDQNTNFEGISNITIVMLVVVTHVLKIT